MEKNQVLALVLTLLGFVAVTSLLTGMRSTHHTRRCRVFPNDADHCLHWIGPVLLASASCSTPKRRLVASTKMRLTVQFIPGILSPAIIVLHLVNRVGGVRAEHPLSLFTSSLMAMRDSGGITGGTSRSGIFHGLPTPPHNHTMHVPWNTYTRLNSHTSSDQQQIFSWWGPSSRPSLSSACVGTCHVRAYPSS